MKITRTAFVALFFVGVTFAQIGDEGPDDGVRLPEALIEELGLAESQIDQLRANNQSFREQVRPLAQDAAAKRRELRQEKRSESPNETVLGTLTMELEEIQAQIEGVRAAFRASARAILTTDQVNALGPIEDAVALGQAGRQAVVLNLVSGSGEGARANVGPRNRRGGPGHRGPRRARPAAEGDQN